MRTSNLATNETFACEQQLLKLAAETEVAMTLRQSPILYQNAERDITLIDIPTSIAAAQGRSDVLLSTTPLEAPIKPKVDYRPKTQKAKANKAHELADNTHVEYKVLFEHALAHIHVQVSGPWCAPRKLMTQPSGLEGAMDIDEPLGSNQNSCSQSSGNVIGGIQLADPERNSTAEKELDVRMREWAVWTESKGDDTAFNLQQMMASLGAISEAAGTAAVTPKWTSSYRPAREFTSSTRVAETVFQSTAETQTEPWTSVFHNPDDHSLELTVSETKSLGQEYCFTVPPCSTLFLGDCAASDSFRTSFRALTAEYNLPRHFDLVLLDPPWPNRSAKRKGAYKDVGGMPYIKKVLLGMDMDTYLEHNALVGVWITNKDSLRSCVLDLFERWNVGLVEEWVWIKTTTKGEPMFDIDTLMRKPYEVLLLGRAAPKSWTTMAHATNVKRRVIAAVPDIHSRKPCLKELLEPYLLDPKKYSALEVFSRYLVSGWTSWGNEVLKYNWEGYWAPAT
jgi:N6-adenosine-specific RNA methylase IME4